MITLPWYAKQLLLPPADLLLLALFGLLVLRWRPRLGRACVVLALVGLYLLSTPAVANWLLRGVQAGAPLVELDADADAIVVLSAGAYGYALEFGGDTTSATTLERLRYAVRLHRRSGAPLLVTGGRGYGRHPPIGALMAEALMDSFGIAARWVETEAANTYQNAVNSAAILHPLGVTRVYLVTHAWHMRRAIAAFEALGFDVVPAPTRIAPPLAFSPPAFVPNAGSLGGSAIAIHEWIGLAWYRLAYI